MVHNLLFFRLILFLFVVCQYSFLHSIRLSYRGYHVENGKREECTTKLRNDEVLVVAKILLFHVKRYVIDYDAQYRADSYLIENHDGRSQREYGRFESFGNELRHQYVARKNGQCFLDALGKRTSDKVPDCTRDTELLVKSIC